MGLLFLLAIAAQLPGLIGKISFSGPAIANGFGINVDLNCLTVCKQTRLLHFFL